LRAVVLKDELDVCDRVNDGVVVENGRLLAGVPQRERQSVPAKTLVQ
jgi:hypothetical protein